jgi:hypothetical protein
MGQLAPLRRGKQSFSLDDNGDDGDGGGGGGDDDDDGPMLTHGGQPINEKDLKRRSEHQQLRGKAGRNYDDDDDDGGGAVHVE